MSAIVHWNGNKVLKAIDATNEKLVKKVAAMISRKAKQKCPVKTGTLKRSIRPVVNLLKGKAEVVAGGDVGCAPGVGSSVEYAVYVELGTHKQAAQPFLRPAIEEFSDEDMKNVLESL